MFNKFTVTSNVLYTLSSLTHRLYQGLQREFLMMKVKYINNFLGLDFKKLTASEQRKYGKYLHYQPETIFSLSRN